MTAVRPTERAGGPDRGSVTAETAVALPSLLLVTAVLLGAVTAGAQQLRCLDAARDAARVLARGDAPDEAQTVVTRTAPGATLRVSADAGLVRAQVSRAIRLPVLGTSITLTGDAVTAVEPQR